MKPRHFLPLILFIIAVTLMVAIALHRAPMPARPVIAQTTPLPTVTPTATPTPGWWGDADFATPTLPKLPGVKKPAFSGSVGGQESGQPVPFTVLSCPTAGVKITEIRTASGPLRQAQGRQWWHIFGVADIPNLWYWKAEASVDGQHWAMLYRSERATSGLLVRLNLTTLPGGPLHFRLTAVDRTGNYPGPCVVRARK